MIYVTMPRRMTTLMKQVFLGGEDEMIRYTIQHIPIVELDIVVTNVTVTLVDHFLAEFVRRHSPGVPRGFRCAIRVVGRPIGGVNLSAYLE